jgi:hypothetical protein
MIQTVALSEVSGMNYVVGYLGDKLLRSFLCDRHSTYVLAFFPSDMVEQHLSIPWELFVGQVTCFGQRTASK